jgi:DNA processing protein
MENFSTVLPWLALNRLPNFGPVSQRKLLEQAGSMQALLSLPHSAIQPLLNTEQALLWCAFCDGASHSVLRQQALHDMELAEKADAEIITVENENYSRLLLQIAAAPTVLYVRGDTTALHLPQLAIVGSRHASATGLELAHEFAATLAQHGLAITSGLALGIDGAVHRGAIQVHGKTVAVVATGIDMVYPQRHAALAQEIVESGGAIVTEMAPQSPPVAQNFPRRNRIISGLSLGTLVVEANVQSGSLITARCAMEQGREVFALPGSVRSLSHRGCHALIRQGATLVETTQDIVDELGGLLAFKQKECVTQQETRHRLKSLSAEAQTLFCAIDHSPVSLDTLIMRCNLSVDAIAAALMDLEMEGVIAQEYGLYARV